MCIGRADDKSFTLNSGEGKGSSKDNVEGHGSGHCGSSRSPELGN